MTKLSLGQNKVEIFREAKKGKRTKNGGRSELFQDSTKVYEENTNVTPKGNGNKMTIE